MHLVAEAVLDHRAGKRELTAERLRQTAAHRNILFTAHAASRHDQNILLVDSLLLFYDLRGQDADTRARHVIGHGALYDTAGRILHALCAVHDAVTHGRELRTRAADGDLRHDVAAERRADLNHIRTRLDVECRTVRSQTGMEPGGQTRRERAAERCCADKHRTWLCCRNAVRDRIRAAVRTKALKARMLIDIDRVHAVRQQLFGVLRRALAADEHAVHLVTDLARHFSRLTDQLECNRMNIAALLLDVNQKIAPFALVHCVCALLEADRAFRTAAHAHAAHAAGIAHSNPLRLDAKRTERTFINTFAAKRALCSVKLQKIHAAPPQMIFFPVRIANSPSVFPAASPSR